MCVPVPVDSKLGGNLNPRGKVTGGLPPPQLDMLNQMTIPFRRAVTGRDVEEQRRKFSSPGTLAATLAPLKGDQSQYRRPY